MAVDIVAVAGKAELDEFLHLPYRLYADDPHYVFPLLRDQRSFFDPEHNPFHRHAETDLWVARRGGETVGRIGACIDSYHNGHHQERVAFFGFFESVDDGAVATALMETVRNWATQRGMATLRGPACVTTNHDYLGLLVKGHDSPPMIGMPYQPPHYEALLEDFGLVKCKDL